MRQPRICAEHHHLKPCRDCLQARIDTLERAAKMEEAFRQAIIQELKDTCEALRVALYALGQQDRKTT